MGQCKSTSRKMKVTLALLVVLGIALVIEAVPQRGRRPGRRRPGDDSSEEDGEGGRRGGGGRGKGGKGGLKQIFKACKDSVPALEDLECPSRQRPKVFPESACADLSEGDEFPEKGDMPKPCEDASEGDDVSFTGCFVCSERGRRGDPPTGGDTTGAVDLSVSTTCIADEDSSEEGDLKPDKDNISCRG